MTGIDLFSGAGGMSLGAEWAGISVRLAVEADAQAAETFSKNHPSASVINKRVEDIKRFPDVLPSGDLIVFGGPPCQGFSTSNQRTRTESNPTNWLFREYFRCVRLLRPTWVIFENVTGMIVTSKGAFLKAVLAEFSALGYTVSSFVLNAADFGVPQRRSRLFIVANRDGIQIQPLVGSGPKLTVRDAIDDLPVLENGAATSVLPYRQPASSEYAQKLRGSLKQSTNHLVSASAPLIVKRYTFVSQGGNWADIPGSHMQNYADRSRCHTGIYKRLRYDEPSIVIGNFRKNMLIHPEQHRGLSVREAARIQSFPDNFVFCGTIGFQQQQVGNAVPPLLAQAVFATILHLHRERC